MNFLKIYFWNFLKDNFVELGNECIFWIDFIGVFFIFVLEEFIGIFDRSVGIG